MLYMGGYSYSWFLPVMWSMSIRSTWSCILLQLSVVLAQILSGKEKILREIFVHFFGSVDHCWWVRNTRCKKGTVHFPLHDYPSGKAPWVLLVLKLSERVFVTWVEVPRVPLDDRRSQNTHGYFYQPGHSDTPTKPLILSARVCPS